MTDNDVNCDTNNNNEPFRRYNLDKLQIFIVDGVFARMDKGEGRLLFYNNNPVIRLGETETIQVTNCLCELRMSQNNYRKIISTIIENIITEDPGFLKSNENENSDDTESGAMFV